ncbi:hypothetical protein EVAR_10818_1 [Eumeta japonica]|uniref:Uncharacterized protein n=1 Tax=Eumeta variegata TaxID=151549 RepID=A0A4C1YAW7_EUMVA|nr:hypothetical protein EVAR_10818_1 [Eumeta japonica]
MVLEQHGGSSRVMMVEELSNSSAPSRSSPATRDICTRADLNHTERARVRPARLTVKAQVAVSKLRREGTMGRNGQSKSIPYAKDKHSDLAHTLTFNKKLLIQ